MDYKTQEISILFTDNTHIKELNNQFRGIQKPTNVLSFPMIDHGKIENTPLETNLLGDVVISVEKASEEANLANITLEQRISQLLIHGILHLIGYDHEKGKEDFLKMENKSLELIKLIEENLNLSAF